MVIIIYCLAVLLFCVVFYCTKILVTCNKIITIAQTSVRTITDKSVDDSAKEKAIQAAAINMFKSGFLLLVKIVITFGITILPLWLADVAGMASFSQSSEFSLRFDVLVITTIVLTAIIIIVRRLIDPR